MATAVLDIDLKNLPPIIAGLENYSKAFILARYGGRPVASKIMPVKDGQVVLDELVNDILNENQEQLRLAWTDEKLSSVFPARQPGLKNVTVAICTRNRAADLKNCLDKLLLLRSSGHEILVVDNAPSNDETKNLVLKYPGVRYVLESLPGLNTARNTAIREANGSIIAFIDDDALPDSNWLNALVKNFDHPLVMCVTGMTMPSELETPAQEAFEAFSPFSRGFARKIFKGESMQSFSAGHIGAGANMAIRKEVIGLAGAFDEALDAGTITQSGGDHEYFLRILLKGYHIVYEPEALNWHRHRRSFPELYQTIKGYGTGNYATWTRLVLKGEWSFALQAYSWLVNNQLPGMARSVLKKQGSRSFRLQLLEWYGCIQGPWAYLLSRSAIKKRKRNG